MGQKDHFDRSAGVPPAVAGASRPRFGSVTIRDRGRLPHWEMERGTYFVTFRLADSLPQALLQTWLAEREDLSQRTMAGGRALSAAEISRLDRLHQSKIEKYLDSGVGNCELARAEAAEIVAAALQRFDEARYRLFAWCIMPNHVHAVFKLRPAWELATIIHSWKSYSAKAINRRLHRRGTLWQREYYDHLVRDQDELWQTIRYVLRNPEKAGLRDWRWTFWCGQDAHTTAGETPALQK
ncbi:MAG: transposase [Acidobacteriales bacterium]|nr:transposase [Terriglobales bacterium]